MDILDIMKKHGIEISEDKVADFNKDFRSSYKSAGELKKTKDQLAELQAKIDSSVDFESQYNNLKKKYDEDIKAKQDELDNLNFDSKLSKALSGIEFANSRVANSITSEIKAKGFKIGDSGEIEGLNDYLKELYNNEPDSFKTVDSGRHTWAGGLDTNQSFKQLENYNDIFNRIH